MTGGTVIVKGVVRGRTIELESEPGLPEGQLVSVVLRPALPPGEGLRRSFGAWASDSHSLASQRWFERLPRWLFEEPKRRKVVDALTNLLEEMRSSTQS